MNRVMIRSNIAGYTTLTYNDTLSIIVMNSNNYVNVTKLCSYTNKTFSRWKSLVRGKNAMEDLSRRLRIPERELCVVVQKRRGTERIHGTYVHMELLPRVLDWISESFCKDVMFIIESYCLRESPKRYDLLLRKHADAEIIFNALNSESLYRRLYRDIGPILDEYKTIYLRDVDTECGICFEKISSMEKSKRYFGILTNCDHRFCLECIKTWIDNNKRTCPVCRREFETLLSSRFYE